MTSPECPGRLTLKQSRRRASLTDAMSCQEMSPHPATSVLWPPTTTSAGAEKAAGHPRNRNIRRLIPAHANRKTYITPNARKQNGND